MYITLIVLVQLGDNVTVMALGRETVELTLTTNSLNLELLLLNVLYIPVFHYSIISSGVPVSNNLTVTFDLNRLNILKDGATLATAVSEGNLFKIQTCRAPS